MLQKIIKVGNSFAVTIPKKVIDSLKASDENLVDVKIESHKRRIIVDFTKEEKVMDEIIDPEVYKVAKSLLRRYLPAFKELAKK